LAGTVFDYRKAADDAHIPQGYVDTLEYEVRKELDNDEMLFELHMLRAINEYKYSQHSEEAIAH
jgi:hypothetical protein